MTYMMCNACILLNELTLFLDFFPLLIPIILTFNFILVVKKI